MVEDTLTPWRGLWRDHSQSRYQSLVLTLSSYQALFLLAILSAFIAYTQTMVWIIIRFLMIRIYSPNRLDDSEDPKSLRNLSQARALKVLLFKEEIRIDDNTMTPISKWFGIAAISNILVFILLGAFVPYYLTGSSGPNQVQSQTTLNCTDSSGISTNAMQLAVSFYVQCLLNSSADTSACGGYAGRMVENRQHLNFSLDPECPFEEGSCAFFSRTFRLPHGQSFHVEGINKAVRFAYLDMQPADYGLNADSRVRQSHSLTCAPLMVNKFRIPFNWSVPNSNNVTVYWVGYPPGSFNASEKYTTDGESNVYHNPPPLFSVNLDLTFTLYELTLYRYLTDYDLGMRIENYHSRLRRNDSDAFLVRFTYGTLLGDSLLGLPKWDPAFAFVHEPSLMLRGASTTVLGCFEQYQLCFDDICTSWTSGEDAISGLAQSLQSHYSSDTLSEIIDVHELLIRISKLQNFMKSHNGSPSLMHSIHNKIPQRDMRPGDQPKAPDQWYWEVRSWFEISLLAAKLSLLESSHWTETGTNLASNHSEANDDAGQLCNKVLFLDDSSTNITFIELVTISSGLLVICLIASTGSIIKAINSVWEKVIKPVCEKGVKKYQRVRAAFKILRNDLLRKLQISWTLVRTDSKRRVKGPKLSFRNIFSLSRTPRTSDFNDDGILSAGGCDGGFT